MKRLALGCLAFVLAVLLAVPAWAQARATEKAMDPDSGRALDLSLDWNQWRGPSRLGHASVLEVPAKWPEALQTEWRVEVGEGYSGPVISGDRAFLLTRQGDDEVAMAIDLADGREIWSARWPTPYEINQYATAHGKWPRSTPIVHDGVVCFLGVDARLTCHDADSGKQLWIRDESKNSGSEGNFCGSSMSPLIQDGVLYAHLGDDSGGEEDPLAAGLRTGEETWSWDGQGPSYTSPVIATFDGVRQLVTMGSVDLLGFAIETGQLLWRRPFPDQWNQNIATPLWVAERLLFADVENGTLAVRPERAESGWVLKELWHDKELTQYMASPVTDGKLVYGFTNQRKGQLFVLDPESGEVLWRDEGRGGRNATLTLAGPWLLVASNEGELRIYQRQDRSLRLAARYETAPSETWASPAWLADGLLVKDAKHLARLSFGASSPSSQK